jgi:hypothetical protein
MVRSNKWKKSFCPFQGFVANAVTFRHPITQINVTNMGCVNFDDQRLHSLPIFLEVTFFRWNVHLKKVINFSLAPPTHSP